MAPTKRGEPDLFFPEKGERANIIEAQAVCVHCPVFQQCKEYRELTDSDYGVWAGDYRQGGR